MNQQKGNISVKEAGRRGGQTTARTHGREFYQEIGTKGGHRVRDLINEAKSRETMTGGRGKRSM